MPHPIRPADPALARAADAIADETAAFVARYAPGSPIPAEPVRSQVAQGLLDGDVGAFGCVLVMPRADVRDRAPRLVLAAIRLRVVRRPLPATRPSPFRNKPLWAEAGALRLVLEPGRPLATASPRGRDWFVASSPIAWRQPRDELTFRGPLALDHLTLLDADRALAREAYDVASIRSESAMREGVSA